MGAGSGETDRGLGIMPGTIRDSTHGTATCLATPVRPGLTMFVGSALGFGIGVSTVQGASWLGSHT